MRYQFRALCSGAPIILDDCGVGYEADSEDEAWDALLARIGQSKFFDRSRYVVEPFPSPDRP